MSNEKLYLRRASVEDIYILFEWVNDMNTRQNAFNSHIITYEEHTAWFNKMLCDSRQAQYILMYEDNPVGQIRLTIEEQKAEIDYSISVLSRGKGFGKTIINLIKEQARKDYPNIRKLVGKVKTSNIASYQCFLDNEFQETYRQLEYEVR